MDTDAAFDEIRTMISKGMGNDAIARVKDLAASENDPIVRIKCLSLLKVIDGSEASKEILRDLMEDLPENESLLIQIAQTKMRLEKEQLSDRVEVILDSHAHMDRYAKEGSVSLIMFNLGYLPGGDHSISTRAETTIEALEKGLVLLHEGGMISLLIYSGGDSGFDERDQVLAWLRKLPDDKYTVLIEAFYNKPNHPPLPVYILKNEAV